MKSPYIDCKVVTIPLKCLHIIVKLVEARIGIHLHDKILFARQIAHFSDVIEQKAEAERQRFGGFDEDIVQADDMWCCASHASRSTSCAVL